MDICMFGVLTTFGVWVGMVPGLFRADEDCDPLLYLVAALLAHVLALTAAASRAIVPLHEWILARATGNATALTLACCAAYLLIVLLVPTVVVAGDGPRGAGKPSPRS